MDRGYAIRFIRRGGVNLYKRTPGWPEKDYNHELIDSLPQFGEGSLYFPEGHYTTRVVVSGSNIKVYRVDSGVPTLLLEHNDSTFPSGGIGFSARSANFRVKDIKLTYNSLPDPALPYQQIECTVSAVGDLGMLNTTFLPFQAFGTTITNVGPIPAGGQQFKVRCENFDASSFCEETVDVTIGTGPAVSIVPLSSAISSGSTQGLTWTVNGPADSCSFTTSGVSSPKFSWNNIIFSNFETSPGSNIYTNGYTHTDTTEGPHDYTLECSNSGVFSNIETATVTVTNPCGNNTVDAGEECDPGDPADWGAYGQQCTDHPEHNDETGTVTCTGLCQYDYGSCIGGGPCCDGYDNDNDWLIDENDPGCWELGGDPSSHFCNPEGEDNCGNGLCEPITSENPVSCPDDCTVVDTGER
jgi:hypothetical protein